MTIQTKTIEQKDIAALPQETAPLTQGVSPLRKKKRRFREAAAKSFWSPGAMLRTCQERRFFYSTQSGFGIFPVKSYSMEVFPPDGIEQRVKQRWANTLESVSQQTNVVFIATVTIPCIENTIAPMITLKSQLGGIYAKESTVPQEMVCVRKDAKDTVIATLNRALIKNEWFPDY